MLEQARLLWRFSRRLPSFLEEQLSPADAFRIVRKGLEQRQERFLVVLRRGIYDNPHSPYLWLLRQAGAEYGDIEQLVRSDGVEAALERLYQAGVRIALDEFKGRRPIRAGNQERFFQAHDFDNPIAAGHFFVTSSGSTGKPLRMTIDLDHLVEEGAHRVLVRHALGCERALHALWRAVPPGSVGLKQALVAAKFGTPVNRWFSPTPVIWKPPLTPSALFLTVALLAGKGLIPRPEHVPLEQAARISSWLAEQAQRNQPVYISLPVTGAIAIAEEALRRGLNLTGVTFRTGGEPLTAPRLSRIQSTGARAFSAWALSESGPLAGPCPDRVQPDELHLFTGLAAVLVCPRAVHGGLQEVPALYVTTLSPTAPKLMLNVEVGDSAVLFRRRCGCLWDRLGLAVHLHSIRSYEKLTSAGMHITAEDILEFVDRVLPARHGGWLGAYQLAEDRNGNSSKIFVLVDPEVQARNLEQIPQTFFEFLESRGRAGWMMAQHLRQAGCVEVRRLTPVVGPGGKRPPLIPLHLIQVPGARDRGTP